MKKNVITFWLVLFFFCFSLAALPAEKPAPPEVLKAAEQGLISFLKAIPAAEREHYGFSATDNLSLAKLEEPFRVFTINPDKILNYKPAIELTSLVSATDLWFFPVSLAGTVRTILTVDKMEGQWQAVAIGSSGLAKQLEEVIQTYPKSAGYSFQFVRIYQARSDFVMLSRNEISKMVPLESARMALRIEAQKAAFENLQNPVQIIPKLKPLVRQNLQSDESGRH